MSASALFDILLWAFLGVCALALIGMTLFAMFGDYFVGRDQ